jgi:hypothetical protein
MLLESHCLSDQNHHAEVQVLKSVTSSLTLQPHVHKISTDDPTIASLNFGPVVYYHAYMLPQMSCLPDDQAM